MTARILIADDEPAVIDTLGELLTAHGYHYDGVDDLETTHGILAKGKHRALILDMNMPLRPKGKIRDRKNGYDYLGRLRMAPDTKDLPVIVHTGEDRGEATFHCGLLRKGGTDQTFVVQKGSLTYIDDLTRALDWLGKLLAPAIPTTPPRLPRFDGETRHLAIYEDHATLCDIEVWNDRAQDDMRKVLLALAHKTRSGNWRRVKGTTLNEDLPREPTNPISKPIHSFRTRCEEMMRNQADLDCGRFDVIAETRGGGYHFAKNIEVEIIGEEDPEPQDDDTNSAYDLVKEWVLAQLDAGEALYPRDVISEFSRTRSRAQIKRDLQRMREDDRLIGSGARGLIVRLP